MSNEDLLSESPQETWGDTILFRLAKALGHVPEGVTALNVHVDDTLAEALEIIAAYKELEK